eukprot:7312984-Alexandrium_andersonii.AAC.1
MSASRMSRMWGDKQHEEPPAHTHSFRPPPGLPPPSHAGPGPRRGRFMQPDANDQFVIMMHKQTAPHTQAKNGQHPTSSGSQLQQQGPAERSKDRRASRNNSDNGRRAQSQTQ